MSKRPRSIAGLLPRARRTRAALAAASLLAVGACSTPPLADQGTTVGGEITVAAAASLTGTLDSIAQAFESTHRETRVRVSYASSSALAQQIDNGAPLDVFASANEISMQETVRAGRAREPESFATNQLTVVTPAANPGGIKTWRGISEGGLRVAVCVDGTPCGIAARTVFERTGVVPASQVGELDVRAVLARVESGEADAGIVYRTDARSAGSRVLSFDVPDADNVITTYQIAPLTDSGHRGTAAAFAQFVATSPEALRILSEAGFGPPPRTP